MKCYGDVTTTKNDNGYEATIRVEQIITKYKEELRDAITTHVFGNGVLLTRFYPETSTDGLHEEVEFWATFKKTPYFDNNQLDQITKGKSNVAFQKVTPFSDDELHHTEREIRDILDSMKGGE